MIVNYQTTNYFRFKDIFPTFNDFETNILNNLVLGSLDLGSITNEQIYNLLYDNFATEILAGETDTLIYSGFRNIREIPLVGLSRPVEFQDLFCGGLNGEGLNE